MPGPSIDAVRAIAAHEFHAVRRGKMGPAFGGIFALLAVGITLAGLGASGQLVVQGYTRTAVSLLTLSLYLLPLVGAMIGAAALGAEDGGTELLLAQPLTRGAALLGRTLGLAAAVALVSLTGFGAAGVVVAAFHGLAGVGGYLLVAAGATAVGWAGLGVGVLLGVVARRRGAAVGWALAAWFVAAVLYDLAAIGVLQLFGTGQPGPWLVALLALNPIDGVRALGLVGLGADVLLGPTGAALQRLFGEGWGTVWVLASLGAWLALPFAAAGAVFRRRDF